MCGFENVTCFQSMQNFVYLFMHLSCCLLIMYLSITNTMMESTTSTLHLINLNSLFDIEKNNEFEFQTQVTYGSH